ncbi:MAG: exodeoxyribonuclease VII large subunit [Chloroflexia bacterium]|nr:exodeoxyribonuclease VII large subunit [Chloroflexia bacterium]
MTTRVLPVGAFVCLLRESLEVDPFYSDLWLEGEIRDLSRSSAGHVYFSLRDDDGTLKCVLFRNQALRQFQPLRLGDRAAVHGGLSMYARSGAIQLVADLVRPAGLGTAWLELEYLRQRLTLEGLFDPLRKRLLPEWPHTIGVVTSPNGAAWHDIQTIIGRRYPLTELVLSPAQVQGEGAAESIVAAFDALRDQSDVQVIILARGGGASDDLAAFNDERVIRAVFASHVPVIAGIGHATDRTLVEDAADAYAPTPSAAAEICVPSAAQVAEQVHSLSTRLVWLMSVRTEEAAATTSAASRRLAAVDLGSSIRDRQNSVKAAAERLTQATRSQLDTLDRRVTSTNHVLQALDPRAVLSRGYAALQNADDAQPLFSISQVKQHRALRVTVHDGSFSATVKEPAGANVSAS